MANLKINESQTSTILVHQYLANQIAEEADRIAEAGNFLPGRYEHIFIPSEIGDLGVIYRPELSEFHDQLTKAVSEATMKVMTQQENAEMFVGLVLGVAREGKNWFELHGAESR